MLDAQWLRNLESRLSAWLAAQAGSADVRVGPLQAATGGFSNITLMGDVHRPGQPPEPIVLRLQPEPDGLFANCDVARQYTALQRLAGSAVPVPALRGLELDATVLGAPFYVMERVSGLVPNENPLYHLEGWFHELDAAAQRAHWFSGIDTLAAIARVDWRACGFNDWLPPAGVSPLQRTLDASREELRRAESLARPYPALHAAHRWLRAHQPGDEPGDEPLALSWGDAKLGNCVFREGRVVAALDWEMATLAHPVADLAWWLVLDESLSTGWGVPRLSGLPSREDTIAHWQRASGHSAADLPYYEVLAGWRFAIIMARIGELFMQRGLVPRAAQMDLDNGGATLLALLAQRHGF